MEWGANKNMAFEYSVKIKEVDKIQCAIEEIFKEFKKTKLLSKAIMDDGKVILPLENEAWDRWLELEEFEGEIYYWSGKNGNEIDIINNAITNALRKLQMHFNIEEE